MCPRSARLCPATSERPPGGPASRNGLAPSAQWPARGRPGAAAGSAGVPSVSGTGPPGGRAATGTPGSRRCRRRRWPTGHRQSYAWPASAGRSSSRASAPAGEPGRDHLVQHRDAGRVDDADQQRRRQARPWPRARPAERSRSRAGSCRPAALLTGPRSGSRHRARSRSAPGPPASLARSRARCTSMVFEPIASASSSHTLTAIDRAARRPETCAPAARGCRTRWRSGRAAGPPTRTCRVAGSNRRSPTTSSGGCAAAGGAAAPAAGPATRQSRRA